MNIETKEIYSELYQVLKLLGNEYIDKLPKSLFNMIEEKRNMHYNPKYTENIPLNKQNIKKETISILALLHLNYWCENEKEKYELNQILKNNEIRHQDELRKKYNGDNIFKKHGQENMIKNEVNLVEYKKESIFKRFIKKVKNILHIN